MNDYVGQFVNHCELLSPHLLRHLLYSVTNLSYRMISSGMHTRWNAVMGGGGQKGVKQTSPGSTSDEQRHDSVQL